MAIAAAASLACLYSLLPKANLKQTSTHRLILSVWRQTCLKGHLTGRLDVDTDRQTSSKV